MNEAELLVRDDHAVIVGVVRHTDPGTAEDHVVDRNAGDTGQGGGEVTVIAQGRADARSAGRAAGGPATLGLDELVGADLAEALDEWARVCAAIRRTGSGAGRAVVSRRGGQLALRVASMLDEPVRYRDPMTDGTTLVHPPRSGVRPAPVPARAAVDTTPWATGLTAAAFIAVFVVVAMLALASSLATETAGWVSVVAAAIVTAGLAPSLWLGRRVPVVRWIVLGAVAGTVLSWVGVLFIAFA